MPALTVVAPVYVLAPVRRRVPLPVLVMPMDPVPVVMGAAMVNESDAPGVAVVVGRAGGVKCARSWRYFDPATADPEFPDVTPRDAAALRELKAIGRA